MELVVVDGDLAKVGLALPQRIRIGALMGDQAAAGAVFDPVFDFEPADLARPWPLELPG